MRIQLFEKWIELNYISRVIPKKLTTNIVRQTFLFTKTDKKNTNWFHSQFPGLSRETNYLNNKHSIVERQIICMILSN